MKTNFHTWDDGEAESRRLAIIQRARVEGIEAAYESALAICRDKNAPAQAKSNASRTLLEIGGMLNRADRQDTLDNKELHEMTMDELQAHYRQLRNRSRLEATSSSQSGGHGDPSEDGPFG